MIYTKPKDNSWLLSMATFHTRVAFVRTQTEVISPGKRLPPFPAFTLVCQFLGGNDFKFKQQWLETCQLVSAMLLPEQKWPFNQHKFCLFCPLSKAVRRRGWKSDYSCRTCECEKEPQLALVFAAAGSPDEPGNQQFLPLNKSTTERQRG